MTDVLGQLREIGYYLTVEGVDIRCLWKGPGQPDPGRVRPLLEELGRHKAEALAALRRERPVEPQQPCSSSQGGYPENWWEIPVEWDTETAALVQWFEAAALPAEPFDLLPFVRVVNPTRFYRSLRAGIESGPTGPRGRTGALWADLRRLREVEAVCKSL